MIAVAKMRVQFSGRTPAFQAGCVGSIPITRSRHTCANSSAGQSNCLLSSRSGVRVPFGAPYMVDVAQPVKAPVCGTGDRGFESHLPPHKKRHGVKADCSVPYIGLQPRGKATDFDSVIPQVQILPAQPKACRRASFVDRYLQLTTASNADII